MGRLLALVLYSGKWQLLFLIGLVCWGWINISKQMMWVWIVIYRFRLWTSQLSEEWKWLMIYRKCCCIYIYNFSALYMLMTYLRGIITTPKCSNMHAWIRKLERKQRGKRTRMMGWFIFNPQLFENYAQFWRIPVFVQTTLGFGGLHIRSAYMCALFWKPIFRSLFM